MKIQPIENYTETPSKNEQKEAASIGRSQRKKPKGEWHVDLEGQKLEVAVKVYCGSMRLRMALLWGMYNTTKALTFSELTSRMRDSRGTAARDSQLAARVRSI